MGQTLLKNIQKGVKSALVKQRIITHLIYAGSTTITDLSKSMGLSVPTVTKFVDEMCKEGYVNDCGKLETSGGRHPSLYGLNADSAYFIGVAMAVQSLSLGAINFKGGCASDQDGNSVQAGKHTGMFGTYLSGNRNIYR